MKAEIILKRTNSENPDFLELVKHLDADLAIRDGDEHAFYNQFNKLDAIKNVVIAYLNGEAVGAGGIKQYDSGIMEVKRMFVLPENRGKGIAAEILKELEKWARELGFNKCVLETGIRQPEAIALYKKCGYKSIPNYGQYRDAPSSVCFEKFL